MSARALFSSFLLALFLATTVAARPAVADSGPVATIALGAKQHTAETKAANRRAAAKAAKRRTAARRAAARAARTRRSVKPAAPAACANTALTPDAGNLELIRAALECLHNQIRAQNGLVTLVANAALTKAAAGHSDDMVARDYFAHETPEGGTFDQRVQTAGYAADGEGWTLAENLIWATGELATPAGLMRSWMNSEHHRENIVKPGFRELGLGIELGTPTGKTVGVTITAEFGARTD